MEAKGPHSKAGPSTQIPVLGGISIYPSGEHDLTGCQAGDGKMRCAARATYSSPSPPAGELVAAGSLGVDWRAGLGLDCRGFHKNGNGLGTRKC